MPRKVYNKFYEDHGVGQLLDGSLDVIGVVDPHDETRLIPEDDPRFEGAGKYWDNKVKKEEQDRFNKKRIVSTQPWRP
jgi:hypothetical protein